ncbi:MAG: VWA domain-containing protein, partial [Planctomycetia bacterium]|nr:VWA domain-containing protein [Planctomycetia bacterium]
EELAAPADPRVLYWLRPLLKPVDEQRRQAEDLLFVGNAQALGTADGAWKKLLGPEDAAGSLAHVRAQSKAVADALHRRDEVWARLWSLAMWLDAAEHRQVVGAVALADQLDKLITDVDTLTTKLEAIHSGEAPSLAETSAAAGQSLDHLLDEFNKLQKGAQRSREETVELEKTASFGILSGLLRSPLLTGADRELLREKYDRIVGKLHESRHELLKAQQAGEPQKKSDVNAVGEAQRARQVVENMLAIPAPTDEEATSADERLTRTETAIRKALTGTFAKIRDAAANSEKTADADRAPSDPATAGDELWLKDDLAHRAGLSAADLAGRRRAWFVPRLESPATRDDRTWQSPSRRLMQFDLAALALWHANRALDDFWGPVPGAPEKEPYFARAARDFLTGLDGDEAVRRDAYFADRRQALEAKLDLREKSTRLTARVDEKAVVFEAQVAERKQTAAVTGSAGAPAGTAAVFVVRRSGRELERGLWYQDREHRDVWRQGVLLPADAAQKPAEFTILKEVTAGGREPRKLAARALYRGHMSSDADAAASFDAQMRFVRPIEPVAVNALPPEIRLKGSRHAVTELMFIVDASGSMTENLAGKETKNVAEQKWTLAKSAMRTIMSELVARQSEWDANDEEWRAGLMVYGHRVVWLNRIGNPQYNVRATEEERQQWAANQVLPHTDVELLVDLKRFDADLGERINTALNRASPCGPTPLYYSLREAVKVFERVPPNPGEQPSRHIILVTDGVNNPMPPPGGVDVVPGALQAALRTFKQTHQNSAITVDVVYFGLVGEGERNAIPGLKNFVNEANDLAASRPGEKIDHMHMAASPENLIYSVRMAVERSRLKYRVVRAGTPPAADGFQPANSTWTAPAQGALPDSFTVQIEGSPETFQDVRLEGGEALRLLFKKDKLEFEPQPPEKGLLKRLTAGSGRSRVYVHPFVPASGSDDVLFKYGVQFVENSRFTPRPIDFWAEVTPVRQDEDGTSHDGGHEPAVFFDRSFAPAQRMPVLQFKFPRWPAQANAARVKLWIRFPDARGRSPVDPQRLKYRDVQKSSAAVDGGYKLADFPVALRVSEAGLGNGRVLITVAEQQLDDGRPRDWCRIELSARADAVTRRYFLGERRADHVFEFQDGKRPDPGELELLVTPAAVLKDNALQIPSDEDEIRPVPVTPPSAGDPAPN